MKLTENGTGFFIQSDVVGLLKDAFLLLCFLTVISKLEASPEVGGAPPSPTVITNFHQFWTLPAAEKNQPHRIQAEVLIYFIDSDWGVAWGESAGDTTFLPLRGAPSWIKSGQRLFIDGIVIPATQEIFWDKTTVRLLSDSNQIKTISADQDLLNTSALNGRFVEVEGLVGSQETVTPKFIKLSLIVDDQIVSVFVRTTDTNSLKPDLLGKFARVTGVYSSALDIFGKVADITFWTPDLAHVQVTGSLSNDPRFSVPTTLAEDFSNTGATNLIRVAGIVRHYQPGEFVTIWDESGQIRILIKQSQPLKLGDYIEAVGYPVSQGVEKVLQAAIYRIPEKRPELPTIPTKLRLADQVRSLNREEIAKKIPVSIEGVVTWSDPRNNFIFVLDSSGGIRVVNPKFEKIRFAKPRTMVRVEGFAALGEFAPVITNAVVRQEGIMNLPLAPPVSFEQAMTGAEDGRWVQMRGYVRKVTDLKNRLTLELTTSGGQLIAHVPRTDELKGLEGSLISISGVCSAISNSRRQLTGIELWTPTEESIQVEQSPPDDLFALPQRTIASLREFNSFNIANERVRTSGTVTLHVPGRYLYLQDGDNSLFALSGQTEQLHPGDRIEVVGFPGNDGGKFLLREAVYRRVSAGSEPQPFQLPISKSVNEDLDGLLVSAEGKLLDSIQKDTETRLVIQAKDVIFETRLDNSVNPAGQKYQIGSKLAVTGVYRIQTDEYGKPRSFLLNLRNWHDVKVLQSPPWWTLSKLLSVLLGVIVVSLLALLWVFVMARKNNLLQKAKKQLQAARDRLEERVQERTGELQKQVLEKERAHAALSEAQQRLILASRQAGMAEVATGVLHNVGNILNSVNVSASLINDSIRRFRIENFSKAVSLLNEQNGNLAAFLTEDPRGTVLPGYLKNLAAAMTQNQQSVQGEVESLTKQIEHIKVIVTMQQGYARISGMMEELDPVELMEDAVQINRVAYERHGVGLIRQYDPTPKIFADRHKVLQILINLLSNAKYALEKTPAENRRVVLRIRCGNADGVCFEVQDSGAGIAEENLNRIFNLGFTTKAQGHGFGLHSGANAAKEMHGQLSASSEGPGKGATFILELPKAGEAGVKNESIEKAAA